MRSTDEWIASHDDQAIPPRVKVRVFDRCGGKCAICTRVIAGSLRPAYDHIIALINDGEHREGNLQLLCMPCHALKTKADVAEKSKVARVRKRHIGLKKPSKFACSRDSRWKKKIDGSVVLR